MSLLSRFIKKASGVVGKVAPIASLIPGPIGSTARVASGLLGAFGGGGGGGKTMALRRSLPIPSLPSFQSLGFGGGGGAQPGIGFASLASVGSIARVGAAVVTRAGRAARYYCRKNPGWCAGLGGVSAVESLVSSGQLPPPQIRRSKGITASELRAFKRVSKFTSKYCPSVRRSMTAPAVRGRRK